MNEIELNRESIDGLVSNILKRVSSFFKNINTVISILEPKYKVIAMQEWLMFLIHHIDRLASNMSLHSSVRLSLREEILRNLLDKEFLPPKISERLIDNGQKPDFESLGLSRPTSIEVLLPLFTEEAYERDKYYSSCTVLVGKTPWDEKGFITKLLAKISARSGYSLGATQEMAIITAATELMVENELARQDKDALTKLFKPH